MEKKYTPGPWHVGWASPESKESSTLAVWQKDVLDSGFGSVICKVSPEATMNGADEANAKLIAAAPELLEALDAMLSCFQHREVGYARTSLIRQKAIAAIQKATL